LLGSSGASSQIVGVFYKVGAHLRIAVEDLDAFVKAGRVDAITLASVRRDLGGAV
jgi:hypothetical protein